MLIAFGDALYVPIDNEYVAKSYILRNFFLKDRDVTDFVVYMDSVFGVKDHINGKIENSTMTEFLLEKDRLFEKSDEKPVFIVREDMEFVNRRRTKKELKGAWFMIAYKESLSIVDRGYGGGYKIDLGGWRDRGRDEKYWEYYFDSFFNSISDPEYSYRTYKEIKEFVLNVVGTCSSYNGAVYRCESDYRRVKTVLDVFYDTTIFFGYDPVIEMPHFYKYAKKK
jgi:hypothetical protein